MGYILKSPIDAESSFFYCSKHQTLIRTLGWVNSLINLLSKDEIGRGPGEGCDPSNRGCVGDTQRQTLAHQVILPAPVAALWLGDGHLSGRSNCIWSPSLANVNPTPANTSLITNVHTPQAIIMPTIQACEPACCFYSLSPEEHQRELNGLELMYY